MSSYYLPLALLILALIFFISVYVLFSRWLWWIYMGDEYDDS